MKPQKIVVIGAGSTIYALEIIKDLCHTPTLAHSLVVFVDIHEQRLRTSVTLCRRYAEEIGHPLNVTGTSDRAEALQGADYVVSTALALGYDKMLAGWELAKRHGFQQAGSFHILYDEAFWVNYYQLQLFEAIVKDMLSLCPQAWLFLVSNPVIAGITFLGRKYPQAKILGVCHGYREIDSILQEIELDPQKTSWSIPGVNHFVWLNELTHEGQDAMPYLDRWIAEKAEDYWASGNDKVKWGTLSKKIINLYRVHGVLAVGDTAHWIGNAWPWWYSGSEEERIAWDEPTLYDKWIGFFETLATEQEKRVALAHDLSRKVSEVYPGRSEEHIIDMIDSIANDRRLEFVVNIPNTAGLVPGLPLDFEVEVKARLGKAGIQAVPTKALPTSILAHTYRDRIAPVEMELAAYENRNRDLLLELILMDRSATGRKQAQSFLDELLDLPWNARMKEHYRNG